MSEDIKNVVTHTDPALIPAPIYNAEGKMEHVNSPFISTQMLDQAFTPENKSGLVEKMDELVEIIDQVREQIINQIGRRSTAVGKGFRNYGFMLASNQSINNFPELAPNFVDIESFNDVIEDYLFARDVAERMLTITNDIRDIMNIFGNIGFSFALAYYANVRSIAERTNDQTAISVSEILRKFFTRRRTPEVNNEPSERKLERDLRNLLKGHKEGEILLRNEM